MSPSMAESKLVLYGLLAGILSGVMQFVVTIIIVSNFNDALASFSISLISNAFPGSLKWLVRIVLGVSLFSAVVQCVLYGVIFGVIAEVLTKAGLRMPVAAFISGVLYFVAFGVAPFITLLLTIGAITRLMSLLLVHPATYLALITLFSSFEGPWSRVFEKGPKYY